jgi:hypothetical protein
MVFFKTFLSRPQEASPGPCSTFHPFGQEND